MITAYFAVIKDSFREAFASRVLWILLVLITLLLLALSPLAVEDELASTLHRVDVRTGLDFVSALVEQGQSTQESPGRHIWQLLSDDLKERMDESRSGNRSRRVLSDLISELNKLLERNDFYVEDAWRNVVLNQEATNLLKRGTSELADIELRRFNRLLLDAAFVEHIDAVQQSATRMQYFGFQFGDSLPMDRAEVKQVAKTVLVTVMSLFVGAIGVFVAILVTASVIPQMFESGAIDLLLSKPVSRSLLFLTKFVGGCSFILLNASYFILGLWLILGLRFDIWSGKLLLCIPVFLFLFAIYYSVSAFAGVIWKNTVMSIVMTIVFWGLCFAVGTAKVVVETVFLNQKRLAAIVPAGDALIVTNKAGKTFEWQSNWNEIFEGGRSKSAPFGLFYPMLGPVYDPNTKRLVAIEFASGRIPGMGGSGKLVVGNRDDEFRRISGVSAPSGITSLFVDHKSRIVVVGTSGIYRFEGDPSVGHVPFKIFGFDIATEEKSGKFQNVVPSKTTTWRGPFSSAMDPHTGSIAAISRGKLRLYAVGVDEMYEFQHEIDLETEEPAVLAFAGNTLVVALGNGEVRVLGSKARKQLSSFEPHGSIKPRSAVASPNGRWFAVLFHNRKVWLYDATANSAIDADLVGQADISAVTFSRNNKLLAADGFPRVTEYDPQNWRTTKQFQAESEILETVYRYLINPIYTVFPKPSELDNLVSYLLTDQETTTIGGPEESLESERVVLDVWQPIWSNLAFLTVMLCLTCIYVSRKDF